MYCSRCGREVVEGNLFCQNCGQEVGAAVAAPAVVVGTTPLPSVGAGVSRPLPYAGFWDRFIAYLIDGVILGIPFGFVALALIFMFGGFGVLMRRRVVEPGAAMALVGPMFGVFLLAMLGFLALQWLYFAGMESSERQATFGKSVMSLRVADYEGQRLSFGHASGRFFAKIITGLIPLGIGYLMAAFTERKQALHDFIAGTLVIRK